MTYWLPDHIREQVKAAGIIGAGGAGFPTHVKLDASVDTVIANGAECEPMLHADQHVMARYPRDVVAGLRLAMTATGASRGVIALKREYASAVQALSVAIGDEPDMELFPDGQLLPAPATSSFWCTMPWDGWCQRVVCRWKWASSCRMWGRFSRSPAPRRARRSLIAT